MARTSTATVSRVLSNKPGVAEDTRRNIQQLAERLGYTPNRIAKNLALKKSHVLGFIAADLRNFVYIDFFRRIQGSARKAGYQVLIADSELDVEKERHNIEVMREHRAEGLIVFPVCDWDINSDMEHFLQLKLQKFPFVLVGKVENYGFDYVVSEEVETARSMASRVIELGHREIGFIGASDTNRCIIERCSGVELALKQAGLSMKPEHKISLDEGFEKRLGDLLRSPSRPTALAIVNDTMALMCQRVITLAGLRVPDDVSIFTFGDNFWSQYTIPALSTTHENNAGVAKAAYELLFERIDNPTMPPRHRLVLPEVIWRESTAAPGAVAAG